MQYQSYIYGKNHWLLEPDLIAFLKQYWPDLSQHEAALIDLSGDAMPVPAVLFTLPSPTPPPTAEAGDPGVIAPEIKAIPVPPGFTPVKDSASDYRADDGKIQSATITYLGPGDVEGVKDFYRENLTADQGFDFVDENLASSAPEEGDLFYVYTVDGVAYSLSIMVKTEPGGVQFELIVQGE